MQIYRPNAGEMGLAQGKMFRETWWKTKASLMLNPAGNP
jgi:hypothetical protein